MESSLVDNEGKRESYSDKVVESVCRGVKSRFYSSGRYSPKHEKGVHYFHQLLSKILLKKY